MQAEQESIEVAGGKREKGKRGGILNPSIHPSVAFLYVVPIPANLMSVKTLKRLRRKPTPVNAKVANAIISCRRRYYRHRSRPRDRDRDRDRDRPRLLALSLLTRSLTFVTNSSASALIVNQHTIHPLPRLPPPIPKKRGEKDNHTTSLDKIQFMLARMRSLRNIFIRKDMSVQFGKMDHAWTNPRHPCRGGDLMSDERRPDWFPMFHGYQHSCDHKLCVRQLRDCLPFDFTGLYGSLESDDAGRSFLEQSETMLVMIIDDSSVQGKSWIGEALASRYRPRK